jgi:hypothetical protein
MSERYPGGLITKTPVTPSGPYETSTASGIWTLEEQAYWRKLNQWPIAGSIQPDAQFNYVTMLLHGDGTNGAQNNTFLDSSTNNFTVTRNGNTTQGSFSPYGANWSTYFNGSSALTVPDSSAFTMGSGNFTVELWFNATSTPSQKGLIGQWDGTTDASVSFFLDIATTTPRFFVMSGTTAYNISSSTNITAGVWYHIAGVRDGNTLYLYLNGVQVGTRSVTGVTINDSTTVLGVGRVGTASAYDFDGYISNARIVKGTAVYTAAFTPPTAPLTAITNTSLLTCADNRFIDDSTNAFVVTPSGTPSVQRFSPFGASTAYSTNVIGGSGYFDGTGDYLTAPSDTAFDMGSGDFTIEGWFYSTSTAGGSPRIITHRPRTGGNCWTIQTDGSKLEVFAQNTSVYSVNGAVRVNTWYHFALERNGANFEFYLNGVRANQVSAVTLSSSSSVVYVGADATYQLWSGFITDLRIVKGTAVYSGATYTVPTAPLTAISGTSLLLNTTNGAIFDNAMITTLETVGDAQISTSVVKYGTGSLYFDGTGDYLVGANSPNYAFGTGNFTIEGWFYLTSTANTPVIVDTRSPGSSDGVVIYLNSGTSVLVCIPGAGSAFSSSTTIATGQWYFFAAVRNGSSCALYINGANPGTGTDSTNLSSQFLTIGTSVDTKTTGATNHLTGYIDELRITRGYARYTTTFTPPTAAFPNFGPT